MGGRSRSSVLPQRRVPYFCQPEIARSHRIPRSGHWLPPHGQQGTTPLYAAMGRFDAGSSPPRGRDRMGQRTIFAAPRGYGTAASKRRGEYVNFTLRVFLSNSPIAHLHTTKGPLNEQPFRVKSNIVVPHFRGKFNDTDIVYIDKKNWSRSFLQNLLLYHIFYFTQKNLFPALSSHIPFLKSSTRHSPTCASPPSSKTSGAASSTLLERVNNPASRSKLT